MKTLPFSAGPLISVLLTAITTAGMAQSINTAMKSLAEGSPTLAPVAPTNPVRALLTATISPAESNGTASGALFFIPVGDEVRVLGMLTGLEKDKRHEIVLLPASAGGVPNPAGPQAGKPGGNIPASGVTGANPPTPGAELGMWASDAKGVLGVDNNILKSVVDRFPEGFIGCTIVIKRAPPLNTESERPTIAYGRITAVPAANPASINSPPAVGR
jgi:hypothetical protein